jgi:hypothetical protein
MSRPFALLSLLVGLALFLRFGRLGIDAVLDVYAFPDRPRDASRSEILAARPLHSSEILVLSSSLREVRENPLAPMAHPRHRLVKLP